MSRIDLEFIPQRRIPWIALLFLGISLALASVVFTKILRLEAENDERRERIAALERALEKRKNELKAAQAREELASAPQRKAYQEIQSVLNYPWNRVFSEIEDADSKGVSVLSISHDRSTGITHITAETLEMSAIIEYVNQLNGDEGGNWYIASYRLQPQQSPPTIIAEITQRKISPEK